MTITTGATTKAAIQNKRNKKLTQKRKVAMQQHLPEASNEVAQAQRPQRQSTRIRKQRAERVAGASVHEAFKKKVQNEHSRESSDESEEDQAQHNIGSPNYDGTDFDRVSPSVQYALQGSKQGSTNDVTPPKDDR